MLTTDFDPQVQFDSTTPRALGVSAAVEALCDLFTAVGKGGFVPWHQIEQIIGIRRAGRTLEEDQRIGEVMVRTAKKLRKTHGLTVRNRKDEGYETLTDRQTMTVAVADRASKVSRQCTKSLEELATIQDHDLSDVERHSLVVTRSAVLDQRRTAKKIRTHSRRHQSTAPETPTHPGFLRAE